MMITIGSPFHKKIMRILSLSLYVEFCLNIITFHEISPNDMRKLEFYRLQTGSRISHF